MKKILFLTLLAYSSLFAENTKGEEYNNIAREALKNKNVPKFIEYKTKACENGKGTACRDIGVIYFKGAGVETADRKKAMEFWRKGCDELQNGESCMLLSNQLKAKDKKINEAIEYLKKSCDYKYGKACLIIANLYHKGIFSFEKNEEKAMEFLDKSCKYGFKKACEAKKRMK